MVSNNDVRRASLLGTLRRSSLRRGSMRRTSLVPASTSLDLPWDILDRLLIPILCCHAAAIILSGVLNVLRISDVSTLALFAWFSLSTGGAILFYHHLKVSASGKAILITGCESPLAWCLARKLDELGFTIFAGFTKRTGCADADLLKEESSGRTKILQLDVTSETQMLEASLYISEHLPDGASGLWAVVHCATWVALGELEWIPFAVLRKSIDVNLLGAARLTQIFLPLVRRANGRIVFVSSALARVPAPVRGAQCATQAGIEGLATCLRQELRPRGVDVSIVAAGEFASGTAWLSESSMLEQARNMWSQLSAEQKTNYGEEYFENALRSLEKYTEKEADLGPTIRCLTDALVRTCPLPRYTPVSTGEKVQCFVADHLPRCFYDTIYGK